MEQKNVNPAPPACGHQQPVVTMIAAPGIGMPMAMVFGDYPLQCTCPRCGNQIVTRVEKKTGTFAWILCLILFWFVGCLAFIPFCVDSCKDTEHYCPACNALLGSNKKL